MKPEHLGTGRPCKLYTKATVPQQICTVYHRAPLKQAVSFRVINERVLEC